MAYSATLIPHLEKEDAEVHATKEETSWIGETLFRPRDIALSREGEIRTIVNISYIQRKISIFYYFFLDETFFELHALQDEIMRDNGGFLRFAYVTEMFVAKCVRVAWINSVKFRAIITDISLSLCWLNWLIACEQIQHMYDRREESRGACQLYCDTWSIDFRALIRYALCNPICTRRRRREIYALEIYCQLHDPEER